MSSALSAVPALGDSGAPEPVAADFRLPLRTTDFDAGIAALLHAALNGAPRRDSLSGLCTHLARLLRLPLALIVRRTDSGTMAIEAASGENALWLELQRIPERWDGGLSSQGPANTALHAGGAIQMRPRDEGFALWRDAAAAERVQSVLAIPLTEGEDARILELYFVGDIARGASTATSTVARLAQEIRRLLANLDTIARQALLARALSDAGNAAFITDLEGTIVWSNAAFSALSGHSAADVRGRNPSLLRSGRQGTRYYRDLWATIRSGKVWAGETVDRGRDGTDYTIRQTISPIAHDERITHYLSIHDDVGAERRARERLELASHRDPDTGLLTRAALEAAAAKVLAEADGAAAALVVISLRGLQRGAAAMGADLAALVAAALGRRVHEAICGPELGGALGPFEYVLLLRGDMSQAGVEARLRMLCEKLSEPLSSFGAIPGLDIHCGVALHPADGASFHSLWLKADRQLANEPYRRARRGAPH
jgi:PAS domain S-box-containing protein